MFICFSFTPVNAVVAAPQVVFATTTLSLAGISLQAKKRENVLTRQYYNFRVTGGHSQRKWV